MMRAGCLPGKRIAQAATATAGRDGPPASNLIEQGLGLRKVAIRRGAGQKQARRSGVSFIEVCHGQMVHRLLPAIAGDRFGRDSSPVHAAGLTRARTRPDSVLVAIAEIERSLAISDLGSAA